MDEPGNGVIRRGGITGSGMGVVTGVFSSPWPIALTGIVSPRPTALIVPAGESLLFVAPPRLDDGAVCGPPI